MQILSETKNVEHSACVSGAHRAIGLVTRPNECHAEQARPTEARESSLHLETGFVPKMGIRAYFIKLDKNSTFD